MPGKPKSPPGDTNPFGTWLRDKRGKMPVREAARRADISDTRWRQLEKGSQQVAKGIHVPVQPKPETAAKAARAVGADPAEGLRLAGYDPAQWPALVAQPAEQIGDALDREWFMSLPADERAELLAELQRLHVVADLDLTGLVNKKVTG